MTLTRQVTQDESAPRAVRAARALTMVPGEAPLDDAAVILSGRRILDVGPAGRVLRGFTGPLCDLGDAVLMPGLVNAHIHLELSHLAGKSPRGLGFAGWAAWLGGQPLVSRDTGCLDDAVAAMARAGTGAVIDFAGRRASEVAAAFTRGGLTGLVCHEYFGFRPLPPGDFPPALAGLAQTDGPVRLTASGHALYSTSPDNLRRARDICRRRGTPFSLHLAESADEIACLADGTGPLAELLRQRVLPKGYAPPGRSPVAEAEAQGLLGPGTLTVHAVHLDRLDRATLAASGATVCLCPRSNAHISVGTADAPALINAGIPVCLGTDSLASNTDLDLWGEVRALLAAHPGLPGRIVLAALTTVPARLLGREGELGRLMPGALGGLAVLPGDLAWLADRNETATPA